MKKFALISISLLSLFVVACGGGGGSSGSNGSSQDQTSDILQPSSTLINQCSPNMEKAYLRSYVDETYLWYRDVPAIRSSTYQGTVQQYFSELKTSQKMPSGKDMDRFHWSVTSESFNQQNAGIAEGYGIDWAIASDTIPRDWAVRVVEPTSAAFNQFQRGDKLQKVDGEDFINSSNLDKLNAGLQPNSVAPHTFEVLRKGVLISITLTPTNYSTTPVRYTKVIDTPSGKVGYIYFDDHIAKSESLLISAFQTLSNQGVRDLVLDLRYNGGGLVSIASQVAYMISGDQSRAKIFDRFVYNDKRSRENLSFPFLTTASSANGSGALPTLNLNKITILAGGLTASASEAIINGLRGIDVDVTLIGRVTYGKPYGFVPQPNCGWVYYSVEFKGENNKGFSDFSDGFSPNCIVPDDLENDLGDVNEGRLSAALKYRETQQCPAVVAVSSLKSTGAKQEYIAKVNPAKQLLIPYLPK